MHPRIAECHVPYLGHCDLDLWPSFKIIMSRAYLILFEVGISNLVCGCNLGWGSVAYHNKVTVTLNLTSDLVSRNWCISPIFFEKGIPNLVCKCILGCLSVTIYFWVTVTLTSNLVFQEWLCPEHICYIIWCRNPKFGVVIPLGMEEWCIPFWVTLTLTLTSGLISRFFRAILQLTFLKCVIC